MAEEKPIVYILRGDDREAVESHLHKFYNALGEPDMADMNTTRLEGKSTDLNDLRSAALAVPFLTTRRLVILEDALKSFMGRDKGGDREKFLALLETLPESTALVLITSDSQKYKQGEMIWETLHARHWLIKWAESDESRAIVVDCPLPTDRQMSIWVREKATQSGGSFTAQAASTLAEYVGTDTQRASREITKLLTYVNFTRPVDDDDVRRLTAQDRQTDVFKLVDAMGQRDGKTALDLLHLLLEDTDFIQLFGMIIRQFRLILQAREIMDAGGNEGDVTKTLKQHPFVAKKITAQARQFDMASLESIYHQLLKIDVDAKTGGMDGDVALDVLIARLAN